MIQHTGHFHGSDLEKIKTSFGIDKEALTSFSTNVNPLGISPLLRKTLAEQVDVISTYPDREYTSLRKSIAAYVGCDFEQIVVGNGSTELISLIMKIKAPKNALIVGPTYSEYEHEISLIGGHSYYYGLCEEKNFTFDVKDLCQQLEESIDLLILCNPNNPTSTALSQSGLKQLLSICRERNISVMIDETYVEFAEDDSLITAIPLISAYDNLVVLRGISKFFAAPGLRLGYAITGNLPLIKQMNTKKNPWTINSLAALAGEIMFTDEDYICRTKAFIHSERKRIYAKLLTMDGIKAFEPKANFILVKLLKESLTSKFIFEQAIKRGLMIRDCSTFPFLGEQYIRFCFMSKEKNDMLLEFLKEMLS